MPSIELDANDPGLHKIFDRDAELEIIADGFKFLEGPAWHPYERRLRFSDILGNSILQWSAEAGISLFARNSHMANGNTYDREGGFLSCHHASSRVTRSDDGETARVLASHFEGKELNSPNDIVVKPRWQCLFHRSAIRTRAQSWHSTRAPTRLQRRLSLASRR